MIAHIDADSFFASVIVRAHPALRGKPVLAIGMGGGCVIAATYEAKTKGVRTGMRLSEARQLVPDAIHMNVDFRETGIASAQIESILHDHCPTLQQMSIDEWFLDLQSLVGGIPQNLEQWGKEIQQTILQNTDLSVSIGVAPSKLLAKMAGEYRKPAGVTCLEFPSPFGGGVRGGGLDIEVFLKDRPAAAIPGIGRQRQSKTDAHGWVTAWDIATAPKEEIIRVCGSPGLGLQRELLGECVDSVSNIIHPPKSISRCRTFKATTDLHFLKAHLLKHLEYCTMKMRRWNLGCSEISLWIRTPDFSHRGCHRKLDRLCTTVDEILPVAQAAFSGVAWHQTKFNQIGMALYGFKPSGTHQQSLFEDPEKSMAKERLQEAMDALHTKFGRDSVTRGGALAVHSGTKKDIGLQMID